VAQLLSELKEIKLSQMMILTELRDFREEMQLEFAKINQLKEDEGNSLNLSSGHESGKERGERKGKKFLRRKESGSEGGDFYRDLLASLQKQRGGGRKIKKLLSAKSSADHLSLHTSQDDDSQSKLRRTQTDLRSENSAEENELTKRKWIVFVNVNSGGKQVSPLSSHQ